MYIVTPEEFANIQKVSRVTVYNLIKSGRMPFKHWRIGQQWRIDLDEILREEDGPEEAVTG